MTVIKASEIGANIKAARISEKLTQNALAGRSGVSRPQIAKMEAGKIMPQFDEAVRLADALHVSLQKFVTGRNRQGAKLKGIAHELYRLGIRDLIVSDAAVPGAFRLPEEVIALALQGDRPEARVMEAMPYVLSKQRLNPRLALAFSDMSDPRTKVRLAWLCDLTLAIARRGILAVTPEVERPLELIAKVVKKPAEVDDLGSPGKGVTSPIWRRWNINYSGKMDDFILRVHSLTKSERGEIE